MEIVDNYISNYHADAIDSFFRGLMWHHNQGFPWNFVDELNGDDIPYNYYFAHEFMNQGKFLSDPIVGGQRASQIFNPIIILNSTINFF